MILPAGMHVILIAGEDMEGEESLPPARLGPFKIVRALDQKATLNEHLEAFVPDDEGDADCETFQSFLAKNGYLELPDPGIKASSCKIWDLGLNGLWQAAT